MAIVNQDTVKHVAKLARLRVEGEALARLIAQLDGIVQYVRQLEAVATDHVEPTTHVLPIANVLRPDEPRPSLSQAIVAALAPESQPPFIAVPKIIE